MLTDTYPLADARLRELAGDLSAPVEGATLALVRLDERLGRSDPHLADGVRGRAHLCEAQALAHLAGELVALEDLVLHDAGMDARAPGTGVARAARILAERRRLASRAPEAVLETEALRRLVGLREDGPASVGVVEAVHDADGGFINGGGPALTPGRGGSLASATRGAGRPSASRAWDLPRPLGGMGDGEPWDDEPEDEELLADEDDGGGRLDDARAASGGGGDFAAIDQLIARTSRTLSVARETERSPAVRLRDPDYCAEDRLAAWRALLNQSRPLQGALAAALALDAWLVLEPAERAGEVGWSLAATMLRARGLAQHHLPALGLAYRRGRFRWSPHLPLERRLEGLLVALTESARLADADLKRLTLARELMLRRCEGRRGNSRLGELVGLFIELPLVNTQLAARRLQVSPQAVEAMLKEFGPALPRELTGRKRYRAWGIV